MISNEWGTNEKRNGKMANRVIGEMRQLENGQIRDGGKEKWWRGDRVCRPTIEADRRQRHDGWRRPSEDGGAIVSLLVDFRSFLLVKIVINQWRLTMETDTEPRAETHVGKDLEMMAKTRKQVLNKPCLKLCAKRNASNKLRRREYYILLFLTIVLWKLHLFNNHLKIFWKLNNYL